MQLSHIGYTKKSTGIQGELKVYIEEPFWPSTSKSKFLFVEIDGFKVPYYVESLSLDSRSTVKFEGIDTPDDAIMLSGRPLYMESKFIERKEEEIGKHQYGFLTGFLANDLNSGEVVYIINIESFPQQEMAVVRIIPSGKECLIPLSEEMIVTWNDLLKIVLFDLPIGILDL